MMKKINEEVLCVLRKNDNTNQISIDCIDILNPFKEVIKGLSDLCDKSEGSIPEILNYIGKNKEFDQLSAHYRYCIDLGESYQAFDANNRDAVNKIDKQYQQVLIEKKKEEEREEVNKEKTNDYFNKIFHEIISEVKDKYILWNKAYAINKTYRFCYDDESILTFSHRIDGWSNPVYQLTPNFSIEIKTNFGYGNSSYFYIKLRYKNIDITPFSEWVNYEFARFSEIKRYTKSYPLKNESWLDAMKFAQDACNFSLKNESGFLEKYVVDECEKMVSGLEEIFINDEFSFQEKESVMDKKYTVNKAGHELIEFRSEKISGALDFISKIIEFDEIAVMKSFVVRVEECNKAIAPIVIEESEVLKNKIEKLVKERDERQPEYNGVIKINYDYNHKRTRLRNEMNNNKDKNFNYKQVGEEDLKAEFMKKHPEYPEFQERFKEICEHYQKIIEKIKAKTKIRNNIIANNKKIAKYFEAKSIN